VTFPCGIASEARLAAFTFNEALPLIPAEAAVIVTVPRLRAVARPLTVIEAMLFFDELHVTVPVMTWVVPSEKVPVAANCSNVPSGIETFAGVTAIETRVALVTVKTALDDMLPEDALMLDEPGANPFASPATPFTLMLATDALLEDHCADAVRFCVLPSV